MNSDERPFVESSYADTHCSPAVGRALFRRGVIRPPWSPDLTLSVDSLPDRCLTAARPADRRAARRTHSYITVTSSLHHAGLLGGFTVTSPLHHRYITVTSRRAARRTHGRRWAADDAVCVLLVEHTQHRGAPPNLQHAPHGKGHGPAVIPRSHPHRVGVAFYLRMALHTLHRV